MSGKFGIAFILICTLFIQAVVFSTSGSNPVENPANQSTIVTNSAVTSPCSVDPAFNVSTGVIKPDASFGVGVTQPGIDAGFRVAVCKGVSVPNQPTSGGK